MRRVSSRAKRRKKFSRQLTAVQRMASEVGVIYRRTPAGKIKRADLDDTSQERLRKRRRTNFGDAGKENFFRNVLAALQAAEQARAATNCKAAFRTFNEAELYQGRATLAFLANDRATLDMRKALSQSRRELGVTRERLAAKCRV